MSIRKTLLLTGVIFILLIATLALSGRGRDSKRSHPELVTQSQLSPLPMSTNTITSPSSKLKTTTLESRPAAPLSPTPNVANVTPLIDPIPPGGRSLGGNGNDIRNSPERMAMIEGVELDADRIFNSPGSEDGWVVNQQDMDQQDYATADGTQITKWYSADSESGSSVQAEEAQLPSGEVIDRWYGLNGRVNQVMHQYDERNSFSVYYDENGRLEATRIVRDGNEIFTRYDLDGRQSQKTYTPQVRE